MPLMMDDPMGMDDLQVDDLFGDDAGLSLMDGQSLPSRPPTKELRQRMDELRGSGCCQSIAWSKWGSIASISSSGTDLHLQNLRCDPADGTWSLTEPLPLPRIVEPDVPLKHLVWNPQGSELAVIDSAGRITIVSLFNSLNRPTMSKNSRDDPVDDLQRVVGCYWLNLAPLAANRSGVILHGPAVKENKEGNTYRYEVAQTPVLGPCHPNHNKSALVCVTTNGSLRLIWPQSNGKWQEVHTELESIVSSDDLITHAAICSDKGGTGNNANTGTLLIAFVTTSKQLRTVRALIDWGIPKMEKPHPPNMTLNPSVKTRHLAVTSWLPDFPGDNASDIDQTMVQLSHLEVLPPTLDFSGRSPVPASIIATRSYLPNPASYNQEVRTTVDKWEIRERSQVIHPAFEQLGSRRNSVGSQPMSVFHHKKSESFTTNRVAISMETMNFGMVLIFTYSDGSVEYRDRTTMLETFVEQDTFDKVWHISQLGFSYSQDEPCLQTAMAPSYFSMVQIGNDGKVKWRQQEYRGGDIGSGMDGNGRYSAVVAAFALTCATSVHRNINYDDLLATFPKHVMVSSNYDWLFEIGRIVKLTVDYSDDQHYDSLIRNSTIQLILGIQQSLGFRGEDRPRTFSGKFSWIALQLRNIVILLSMAANIKAKGGPNENTGPLEDPEVINSLVGSVHWVLDLMAWIIDALFTIKKEVASSINITDAASLSIPDLLDYLHAKNNIALHLLLSSPTRGYLTAICRRLPFLDNIARQAIQLLQSQHHNNQTSSISPALAHAYLRITSLTSQSIIQMRSFDTLVCSLTVQVKTAYGAHNLSGSSPGRETARNGLECKMLLGGAIPDSFKSVIVGIFRPDGLLDSIRSEIDLPKLFFADFSILEVDEDEWSMEQRRKKSMTMDGFRKIWLPNPKNTNDDKPDPANMKGPPPRWRRCARCASVMDDVLTPRHALSWLAMQQRRCFCGGYWDNLAPGKRTV